MIARTLSALSCCVLLGGCISLQPSNYQPRYSNYSQLKSPTRCTAAVTSHKASSESLNKLSIRASSFTSPTGDGFSGFIASAMNEEFAKAAIYSPQPKRALSLLMDKNALDTPSGTASADIGVVVTVADAATSTELARVPVQVHREWKSSFVGASAMNSAIGQYSEAIAELNGKLFVDPVFLKAIDCSVGQ